MADPDASLSPEKRLLKLIEEPESTAAQTPAKKASVWQLQTLLTAFSPADLRSHLETGKEQYKALLGKLGKNRAPGLKDVNRGIFILGGILTLCYLISLIYEGRGLDQNIKEKIDGPKRKLTEMLSSGDLSSGEAALENLETRNIFVPLGQRIKKQAEQKSQTSARLVEMTKKLKLTGISYDPEHSVRAFCMIEDIEKGTTSFLRLGDRLGAMNIVRINENSIVLGLDDETIEIR